MNRDQSLTAAMMHDQATAANDQQRQEEEEKPWPSLAQLHQPPEDNQMLLPERSSCIAVKTYLRLCNLPFTEKTSGNAEFMTQGGRLTRLPLLRLGQFQVLAEFEPIVAHVEATRPSNALSRWLSEEQREDMRCMVDHVETVFTLAEIHVSYVDPVNYRLYTAKRSGAGHPWLLALIRRFYKQREALRILRVYQWHDLNADQVLQEVSGCCEALVAQLEEQAGAGGVASSVARNPASWTPWSLATWPAYSTRRCPTGSWPSCCTPIRGSSPIAGALMPASMAASS